MFGTKDKTDVSSQDKRTAPVYGMPRSLSVISEGTVIEGTVTSKGDFRIDGIIHGELQTDGKIVVSADGEASEIVKCGEAEVYGSVKGKVDVKNSLAVYPGGYLEGNIEAGALITARGASLNVSSCKITNFSASHPSGGASNQ